MSSSRSRAPRSGPGFRPLAGISCVLRKFGSNAAGNRFRPLAGISCVPLSRLRWVANPRASGPSRGYVVSIQQHETLTQCPCFRPLAGISCVASLPPPSFLGISFRPLAGISCVTERITALTEEYTFPSPRGDKLCRPAKARHARINKFTYPTRGNVLAVRKP